MRGAQGGSQERRLQGGGTSASPASSVFYAPLCLCTCYSLFLECPSHHLHPRNPICVPIGRSGPALQRLLACSHMVICCPFLWPRLEMGMSLFKPLSHAAGWKKPGLLAQGQAQLPLAVGHLRKWLIWKMGTQSHFLQTLRGFLCEWCGKGRSCKGHRDSERARAWPQAGLSGAKAHLKVAQLREGGAFTLPRPPVTAQGSPHWKGHDPPRHFWLGEGSADTEDTWDSVRVTASPAPPTPPPLPSAALGE